MLAKGVEVKSKGNKMESFYPFLVFARCSKKKKDKER